MPDYDIATRLMKAIEALPVDKQEDAVLSVLNPFIAEMPDENLREVYAEISGLYPPQDRPSVVTAALEVIEGQMALREMGEIGGEE